MVSHRFLILPCGDVNMTVGQCPFFANSPLIAVAAAVPHAITVLPIYGGLYWEK